MEHLLCWKRAHWLCGREKTDRIFRCDECDASLSLVISQGNSGTTNNKKGTLAYVNREFNGIKTTSATYCKPFGMYQFYATISRMARIDTEPANFAICFPDVILRTDLILKKTARETPRIAYFNV